VELTATFMDLLAGFCPVFTDPSFATFRLLMTGWILSVRHRYVTDLMVSSDSVGNGHFSDYHRFFSHAVWDIDQLWRLLMMLIVNTLVGKDATIVPAGDDTLCRKRGLGVFGAGMHHDPLSSSKSKKIYHWGGPVRIFVSAGRLGLCIVGYPLTSGMRSSNMIAKWFRAAFQLRIGIFHFFDASLIAR